jgi:hypothetical protein
MTLSIDDVDFMSIYSHLTAAAAADNAHQRFTYLKSISRERREEMMS